MVLFEMEWGTLTKAALSFEKRTPSIIGWFILISDGDILLRADAAVEGLRYLYVKKISGREARKRTQPCQATNETPVLGGSKGWQGSKRRYTNGEDWRLACRLSVYAIST